MPARVLCLILLTITVYGAPSAKSGYNFIEGYSHTTITFEQVNDLIIIPVVLNDTIRLRLLLDTGTRSMLLYGKKFRKLGNLRRDKRVKVTGWGSPVGVEACLSYPNSVQLGKIHG